MAMTNKDWLIIGIAAVLLLAMTGYITLPNLGGTPPPPGGQQFVCPYGDGQTFTSQAALNAHIASAHAGTTPPPVTTHSDAVPKVEYVNSVTGADIAATTLYADVFRATGGVFNFLTRYDVVASSATTGAQTLTALVSDGSELIVHVAETANPTNGLDYYDTWYYLICHEGNPIYKLTISMLTAASTSPSYTYRVSTTGAATTGYTVGWVGGTTNYWNFGKFAINPRVDEAGINEYITYAGTTLSSVVDGATWVTSGSTANASLAGDTEHITVSLTWDHASNGWGWPMLVVGSTGQMQEYKAVIMVTTNMTAIDSGQFQQEGWSPISDGTLYAEKGFYTTIGPYVPISGQYPAQVNIQVPVYAGSAAGSTMYEFKFWLMDIQLLSNVAMGVTSTTAPTAYGVYQLGPGQVEGDSGFSTSSGKGATNQDECFLTTAA
jgi:hypothetical protein